ncbi:MAG TPA: MerR family transcriptional regulator [Actinomycetota bacterium]
MSVHALRFNERECLFANPVRRGLNGYRVYGEQDIEWLELCSSLRASGMPLAGIRRYAELVRQGGGNEEERLALLRQHRERVTAQIGDLNKCLDLIRWKVGVYEERLAQGHRRRPLDRGKPVGRWRSALDPGRTYEMWRVPGSTAADAPSGIGPPCLGPSSR